MSNVRRPTYDVHRMMSNARCQAVSCQVGSVSFRVKSGPCQAAPVSCRVKSGPSCKSRSCTTCLHQNLYDVRLIAAPLYSSSSVIAHMVMQLQRISAPILGMLRIPWESHGTPMGLPWESSHGTPMGIPYESHGILYKRFGTCPSFCIPSRSLRHTQSI